MSSGDIDQFGLSDKTKGTFPPVNFDGIEQFSMSGETRKFVKSTLNKVRNDPDNQNKILSLGPTRLLQRMVWEYVDHNIGKLGADELKAKIDLYIDWILKTAKVENFPTKDFKENDLEAVYYKIDSYKPKLPTAPIEKTRINPVDPISVKEDKDIVDIVYEHLKNNKDKSDVFKTAGIILKNAGMNISSHTLKGLMREANIPAPSPKKKNTISSLISKAKDKIHKKFANPKAKEFKKLWTERVKNMQSASHDLEHKK